MKPKVFIGSSREGVKIADAVHANLTREAECTVWKDGVFNLSTNTLAALVRALRASDFGVFLFSPDDVTLMRGRITSVVRDNVLFELGLFIGKLGIERCFFLIPDDASDLHLPSDLLRIHPGLFESQRSDNNWQAALNPACMQIKAAMEDLGSFREPLPICEEAVPRSTGRAPEVSKPKQRIADAVATTHVGPVPRSTPMTGEQARELLSKVDSKSARFLRQIAANGGKITWDDMRSIFGIAKKDDWNAYALSYGKGITRAFRHLLQNRSARLVWWIDKDWSTEPWGSDLVAVYIDGPALQSLKSVIESK